ncbi:MAG: folate-binding protein YgfZ [Burkholderiaceae bacterium]
MTNAARSSQDSTPAAAAGAPPPSSEAAGFDIAAVRAMAAACGATLDLDAYGPATRFDPAARVDSAARIDSAGSPAAVNAQAGIVPPSLHALSAGAVAPLLDWGLLRLEGADAVSFLQSQTTNDLAKQPLDEARWHGYCTAKGRLLATMLIWRDEAAVRLLLPRPLTAAIRKRLSMYVLRAKAKFSDESDHYALLGVCGAGAPAALASLGLAAPAPMRLAAAAPFTAIGLPACPLGGEALPRWWLLTPVERLPQLWAQLSASLAPVGSEAWRWMDIRCGLPRIVPATSEQFVPQMLNLDAIDGVSYTKGCYPGQEIVARSHYLGKLKRRSFIGELQAGAAHAAQPLPGSDVTDAGGAPVGMVVSAAATPEGGVALLFESQIAAVQGEAGVRVDGRPVRVIELPYPLPAH